MPKSNDLPILPAADRAAWEVWLEEHHADAPGVWLRFAKKGSTARAVAREDALEVALCYGWIDSQARSDGAEFWLQRFTPRSKRSKWSRINRAAAEALIQAGKMKPAGLAEVERARADGRWERAYASPRQMTVPDDFRSRLEANPAALRFFEALDARNRYAILYRIEDAKRTDTRARRIATFIAMLAEGSKLH